MPVLGGTLSDTSSRDVSALGLDWGLFPLAELADVLGVETDMFTAAERAEATDICRCVSWMCCALAEFDLTIRRASRLSASTPDQMRCLAFARVAAGRSSKSLRKSTGVSAVRMGILCSHIDAPHDNTQPTKRALFGSHGSHRRPYVNAVAQRINRMKCEMNKCDLLHVSGHRTPQWRATTRLWDASPNTRSYLGRPNLPCCTQSLAALSRGWPLRTTLPRHAIARDSWRNLERLVHWQVCE